jgi:hypothetical protein
MRTALSIVALAFALEARGDLPLVELTAGMHVIKAEYADTFQTRARGLMHREKLAQNAGMLFRFDEAATQCMWMKKHADSALGRVPGRGGDHRHHPGDAAA